MKSSFRIIFKLYRISFEYVDSKHWIETSSKGVDGVCVCVGAMCCDVSSVISNRLEKWETHTLGQVGGVGLAGVQQLGPIPNWPKESHCRRLTFWLLSLFHLVCVRVVFFYELISSRISSSTPFNVISHTKETLCDSLSLSLCIHTRPSFFVCVARFNSFFIRFTGGKHITARWFCRDIDDNGRRLPSYLFIYRQSFWLSSREVDLYSQVI